MRTIMRAVMAGLVAMAAVVAFTGTPAEAGEAQGGKFCDIVFGQPGFAEQCAGAGGNDLPIPVGDVTQLACETIDTILDEFEAGGGAAISDPIRELLETAAICTFGGGGSSPTTTTTEPPATTTTTEPPATTTTTTSPPATVAGEQTELPKTGSALTLGVGASGALFAAAALLRRFLGRS